MAVDITIKNGRIVSPHGIVKKGIAIDGEKIVAIADDDDLPQAQKTIDARGNFILPGIIDVHVHTGLYVPLDEEIRDTYAAAYSGVTTIGNYVGMRLSAQRDSYELVFDRWRDIWERNSLSDVFFHGNIVSDTNINEITINAHRYGITSFKFMMINKGPEVLKAGLYSVDDGVLWLGFKEIATLGYPARALVHCENREIIDRIEPLLKATGRQDTAVWAEAHPGFCEIIDAEKAISLAKLTGAPLYIVHIASAGTVDVLASARAEGVDVVGETCPHYLALTQIASLGPLGKVNPPLGDEASQERLWQGIRDGTISCLGSDHCSVTRELKKDMWAPIQGMPGLDALLPIMLSEGVNKGRITLEKLVEVCCESNAKIFGLYPKKGTLQVGSDGDIVIVDLGKKAKLSASSAHYALADYTPYEGWEVKGWPVLTMLRGTILVEDGELKVKPGLGKYLPRSVSS